MIRHLSVFSAVALLLCTIAVNVGLAQDASAGIPVQFAGRIASIDGTTLTVYRLRIDVSRAQSNIQLQVDTQIVIRGILMDNGVVAAQTLSIYVPPVLTNTPLPPTVDPASLSIVQPTPYSTTIVGPVQAIGDGFLVVNDITLQYDTDDPFFAGLQVGDVLEIAANAYDVNGTTTFDVTSINLIGRAADLIPTDTPQGMGMGMGMGEGMGD